MYAKAFELANAISASNWLTTLPTEEHDFCSSKSAFLDALNLRSDWTFIEVSWHYCVYGKNSVNRASAVVLHQSFSRNSS